MPPGHRVQEPARWPTFILSLSILEAPGNPGQARTHDVADTAACRREAGVPWAAPSSSLNPEAATLLQERPVPLKAPPPRPEAQTSSPVYFILVIGGLYFYVHLASRREQTTTALPIVSTHPAPGANPPCSHRLRDCSFHPHANVSNRPLKGSHLPSHATAFPQTLGFQISTAAP